MKKKQTVTIRVPAYKRSLQAANKKKLTVTIGIPAFNEEANIGYLLKALLAQKETNYKLKEIIVVSDGSTDNTDEIVRSIKNSKIIFTKNLFRNGQQNAQNAILKMGRGNIFVFIEADIIPYSENTISELVKPIIKDYENIGMVIGSATSVIPQGFFERILYYGYVFKQGMFHKWRNGNNIYLAGGHSMKAIPKKLAKQFSWPEDVPEDAYIYFRIKELGLNIVRNPNAISYMRNATSFQDRIKQCRKFQSGKRGLEKYFSYEKLRKEYSLPFLFVFKNVVKALLDEPLWISLYLLELIVNRLLTVGIKKFDYLYEPYYTSKKLNFLNK